MRLNYINKIKANLTIYSNQKTTNLLDGTYKSIYKGKSMNFENLRTYTLNDDVKDIDWKSSIRSGELLIKQFIAEKKHNILVVLDSNIKMEADTDLHENKKNIATFLAGTIGYLAIKNGDFVGFLYQNNEQTIFKPFKDNLFSLEKRLYNYEQTILSKNSNIDNLLEYAYKFIKKKMIIFIITDLEGSNKIKSKTYKSLSSQHDVLLININDNYMLGENIYDIDNNNYIPDFFLKDSNLNKIEKNLKQKLLKETEKKLKQNKICSVQISSLKQINIKITELLEEHKYASNN